MKKDWFEKEFPKADLLRIEWMGFNKFYMPFYTRLSNCGQYHIWGLVFTWRLPWHPLACWNKGWDACFRKENNIGEYAKP